jgi:hypothetical protein
MIDCLTNAGPEVQNAFCPGQDVWLLQPFPAILICSQEPVAADMFEGGHLSQRTLQFLAG